MTRRPMRPKPLIPTLIFSPESVKESTCWSRNTAWGACRVRAAPGLRRRREGEAGRLARRWERAAREGVSESVVATPKPGRGRRRSPRFSRPAPSLTDARRFGGKGEDCVYEKDKKILSMVRFSLRRWRWAARRIARDRRYNFLEMHPNDARDQIRRSSRPFPRGRAPNRAIPGEPCAAINISSRRFSRDHLSAKRRSRERSKAPHLTVLARTRLPARAWRADIAAEEAMEADIRGCSLPTRAVALVETTETGATRKTSKDGKKFSRAKKCTALYMHSFRRALVCFVGNRNKPSTSVYFCF